MIPVTLSVRNDLVCCLPLRLTPRGRAALSPVFSALSNRTCAALCVAAALGVAWLVYGGAVWALGYVTAYLMYSAISFQAHLFSEQLRRRFTVCLVCLAVLTTIGLVLGLMWPDSWAGLIVLGICVAAVLLGPGHFMRRELERRQMTNLEFVEQALRLSGS